MNRIVCCLLIIAMAISLCACGEQPVKYSIVSEDIFLMGDQLRSPAPKAIDVELTISDPTIKNGTDVIFNYFGNQYHGTTNNNQIIWDETPKLIDDASISKTTIKPYNSGIKMTHSYRTDKHSLSGEIVQVFSPK